MVNDKLCYLHAYNLGYIDLFATNYLACTTNFTLKKHVTLHQQHFKIIIFGHNIRA